MFIFCLFCPNCVHIYIFALKLILTKFKKFGSFSHLCYHKCMVIFVTVLQKNGQFVNFTSEMAYSGLDLCMKLC